MQQDLMIKLVKGKKPTKQEIANELYEICDREHSCCNDGCPVYRLNDSEILNDQQKPFEENAGCDAFKNGSAMYDFIKKVKLID